jgi:hypothetical protein
MSMRTRIEALEAVNPDLDMAIDDMSYEQLRTALVREYVKAGLCSVDDVQDLDDGALLAFLRSLDIEGGES